MAENSKIEWTDATWNPVTGCTKVSPGCKNCYAETFAERFRGVPGHPYEQGFDLRLWPERLSYPLDWKDRKKIFVNSMSDLFHKDVPDNLVEKVFNVMLEAQQHVFQVLTKRPERMLSWLQSFKGLGKSGQLPAHIWLGTSIENQAYLWRIQYLQQVPAPVKFLSLEPLLGPIKFKANQLKGLDWVIVGGESGPKARPMEPEWVRSILKQCRTHNVKFFFKQWGTFNAEGRRVGKKTAGRTLDGRTWDEMPVILEKM